MSFMVWCGPVPGCQWPPGLTQTFFGLAPGFLKKNTFTWRCYWGPHAMDIWLYMNCWFFNVVNVRNKNPYMDPMPKNESSVRGSKLTMGLMMAGWCSPIFFNEVCWGTIYTPGKKKETNDRNLKMMVSGILETFLSTTRIVWCLCLFWRVYILTMYNSHF